MTGIACQEAGEFKDMKRVVYRGERFVLGRGNKPVAWLVPAGKLRQRSYLCEIRSSEVAYLAPVCASLHSTVASITVNSVFAALSRAEHETLNPTLGWVHPATERLYLKSL
jgi:antitoxin (DNA-binding transcriptional repressor) of toxin-antitoxin stability system